MSVISYLDDAISLQSPVTERVVVSPIQSRVLAQAYTQWRALYPAASKIIASRTLGSYIISGSASAYKNSKIDDFLEAASRDLFMGGHVDEKIGKALVHANPTARFLDRWYTMQRKGNTEKQ